MATRFVRGVLKVLDRIYDFQGDSPVSLFDQSSPIVRVHDVAREAELSAAFGDNRGLFVVNLAMAHVAPGTVYDTADPYADVLGAISGPAPSVEDMDVWLLGWGAESSDVADFDFGLFGVRYVLGSTTFDLLLDEYDDVLGTSLTSGGAAVLGPQATPPSRISRMTVPLFLPRGSLLAGRSTADNVGTVTTTIHAICYAGPRGTNPPGVA